jgi:hypothetical protein
MPKNQPPPRCDCDRWARALVRASDTDLQVPVIFICGWSPARCMYFQAYSEQPEHENRHRGPQSEPGAP